MTILFSFLIAGSIFLATFYGVWFVLTKKAVAHRYTQSPTPFKRPTDLLEKIRKNRWFQPGFCLSRFENTTEGSKALHQSGLIESITYSQYRALKQVAITTISWYILIYILFFGSFFKMLFWEIILIAAVINIPDLVLKIISNYRAKVVDRDLMNFIDMLTMSIESGMNFLNAFEFVGMRTKGILGDESKRVIQKIQFGFSLEISFELFNTRLASNDLKHLTQAVKQAKQLGVSIAETLRIQSQLIRNRRRQRAEELSKTAAVKIAIPLVFFIFPALLIIYIGPAILRLMLN